MLCGHLDSPGTYSTWLTHPVWREALRWLREMPAGQPPGIYQLKGDDMFVNVHGYDTKPRENCRYESHRRYVDLQYCISGGEIVDWQPTALLQATDDYNATKDVVHYAIPATAGAELRMTARRFAIFFPCDGHMPKIADGAQSRVEKLVIKIDERLLA